MRIRRAIIVIAAALAAPATAAAERFVSTSGVPHFDIADVSRLPGWDPQDGRGTTTAWELAVDAVLDVMAAEPGVDATLMTGDLVAGFWGRDETRSGIFGPVRTVEQRRAAVRRAARTYYGEIVRDWRAHPGLGPVLPAMGDHEAGGLPASGRRPRGSHEHRMFRAAVRGWSSAFGRPPRYAHQLPGRRDVLLATLMPVQRSRWGVRATIGEQQLAWLDTVLRGHDGWKILQVEIPPSPLPRRIHTSGTVLHDGAALWRTARELGVHVIFAAEVHALNAIQQPGHEGLPGPVLVTNGGGLYAGGRAHYVVTDVTDGRLTLTARSIDCMRSGFGRLWQTTLRRPMAEITCDRRAPVTGRLVLTRESEVVTSEGALAVPERAGMPRVASPWER